MSLGLLFWILMLLWLVSYVFAWTTAPQSWQATGPNLLLFILLLALGWQVFGAPIR